VREPIDVGARQDPLRQRYKSMPEEAIVTEWARTSGNRVDDPFHTTVELAESTGGPILDFMPPEAHTDYPLTDIRIPLGIHRAIGGDHDLPNPGNLLSAALAACLDSTIRIIANRLGVELEKLEIAVSATADTRGTLVVDRTVPVGFHKMGCEIYLKPEKNSDKRLVERVISAAEYSRVNLRTLTEGVPVDVRTQIDT